jgi:hypothetical protein
MKKYADIKGTERNFELCQKVYLCLQPYRQTTVAYELDLPKESLVHPIFNVSQLKLKLGSTVALVTKLPPVDSHGVFRLEPIEVLDCHSRPRENRPLIELLIRWEGQIADYATWEEFYSLKNGYPHLVGEVKSVS